jgi:hypothetical protein
VTWYEKKETKTQISSGGGGPAANIYTVFVNPGPGDTGTIEVDARGRSSRANIGNFGTYEVWL